MSGETTQTGGETAQGLELIETTSRTPVAWRKTYSRRMLTRAQIEARLAEARAELDAYYRRMENGGQWWRFSRRESATAAEIAGRINAYTEVLGDVAGSHQKVSA